MIPRINKNIQNTSLAFNIDHLTFPQDFNATRSLRSTRSIRTQWGWIWKIRSITTLSVQYWSYQSPCGISTKIGMDHDPPAPYQVDEDGLEKSYVQYPTPCVQYWSFQWPWDILTEIGVNCDPPTPYWHNDGGFEKHVQYQPQAFNIDYSSNDAVFLRNRGGLRSSRSIRI